jgi:hypothetical protein
VSAVSLAWVWVLDSLSHTLIAPPHIPSPK